MMLKRSIIVLTSFMLLFLFGPPLMAANIGERIPHSLAVLDQDGAKQSFESVKGHRGAVVVFVRSVDWCPYCQQQLIDLGNHIPDIEEMGFNVVAISYDSVESIATFRDKYAFPGMMLSDEGSKIIKAFGILNEGMKVGSSYYGVPHPAVYIIGADGVIQNILTEEGFKKRPDVDAIIEAIQAR